MTIAQLESVIGKRARQIEDQFVGLHFFICFGAKRHSGDNDHAEQNRDEPLHFVSALFWISSINFVTASLSLRISSSVGAFPA